MPADHAAPRPLAPEDFDALDDMLDALRETDPETPNWEVCDGFLAAAACCRRPVPPEESLDRMLGEGAAPPAPGQPLSAEAANPFGDPIRQRRFFELWSRRAAEIAEALDVEVESLDDERSFQPEVLDERAALAALPPEEREGVEADQLMSIAQPWAIGFMAGVETWEEDWQPPRDKDEAAFLAEALECLDALTSPDPFPPELPMFTEDGPPTISKHRLQDYAEALWAVYDLRRFWKSLGPRVEPLRRAAEPGRNDPCPCGSGKKYKKCHGAG